MTNYTNSDTLPDKPSRLFKVALRDFGKVLEDSENYFVDMGSWVQDKDHRHPNHVLVNDDRCGVCLAGSVIVKSIGSGTGQFTYVGPEDFNNVKLSRKLEAIDELRKGDVTQAFHYLKLTISDDVNKLNREIVLWKKNPALFITQCYALARDLKAIGY